MEWSTPADSHWAEAWFDCAVASAVYAVPARCMWSIDIAAHFSGTCHECTPKKFDSDDGVPQD
jgi:hypothetical protein